ncbi:MAG: NapC/NirT family cytochrome c [Bacteroidetes bacterium]|jgi:nitrate/TMAO reductase-like tetraheme cytochrome c subunit|nr:NapC/NirT family cytochrome c [Bacteroidota bacterium]
MSSRFPKAFSNPLTYVSAALAGVAFLFILFLMIWEALEPEASPYMGVLTFIALPSVMLGFLALAIVGVVRERNRIKAGLSVEQRFPRIDLNDPAKRRAALTVLIVASVLAIFSAFGSYKAYEYTESDEFCGQMCHTVMQPEFTAYQQSPHARVGCVKCHIGPGAGWFVRSKLSGAYQVYAVAANVYPRPIATPIANLRPARETCEQCHWPDQFYHENLQEKTYYLSDEPNTETSFAMLVKIGGGTGEGGVQSGIHYHMYIANEVSYVHADTQRQIIPWVKAVDRSGKERIYRSTEIPSSDEEIRGLTERKMDCIDCHNRPSHQYHHPADVVNLAMASGRIDKTLPSMKSLAVETLEGKYATEAEAHEKIEQAIRAFYATNHADVALAKRASIGGAIASVQKVYSNNYFPEMNTSWHAFPNNIGHLYFPGCFRCHDGKHVSDDGKVISKDCNVCHSIISKTPAPKGKSGFVYESTEFQHPVDIGDSWKDMNCTECHAKAK